MMDEMERRAILRLGGVCGILGSALTPALIIIAIMLSGSFDWGKSALSDLGVGGQALLFNGALVLGGVLLACFAFGLRTFLPVNARASAGLALLFVGSVCLSLVGVFTEDARAAHWIVSAGYMASVPPGIILAGLSTHDRSMRMAGLLCGMAALLAIGVLPIMIGELGLRVGFAVPEFLEVLPISVWTLFVSRGLIAAGSSHPSPPPGSQQRR
jgi:hypothetical membrane protein